MTQDERTETLARINAVAPSLRKLAYEAWSDASSMQVFVDRLLEEGEIRAVSDEEAARRCSWYGPDHSVRDDALYRIECEAREWTLKLFTDSFELRVTGGWPDCVFVVYRNHGPDAEATLHDRVEFMGVRKQPRLLRSAIVTRSAEHGHDARPLKSEDRK